MDITPDSMSLLDLIADIKTDAIKVNPSYQRSGKIWPPRAKSFLVETILLKMPIPRVLLHELDNPVAPYHSDIIDGQQRCAILRDFRDGKFVLTDAVDQDNLREKKYADLTPHQQAVFDQYVVSIDRYSNVSPKQIRQVFRRLNYYTAPLNAAEQRHAQFFGELSKFVESEASLWRPVFRKFGVFTKNQLERKQDEQLLAEIVDAMLDGLSTPTAKTLREVYKSHENQFSSKPNFTRRLQEARSKIDGWPLKKGGPLMKQYQWFAIILVVMHALEGLAALKDDLGSSKPLKADDQIVSALQPLSVAIREKVATGKYARFWAASHEKTNVRDNRLTRCLFLKRALTG